MILVLEESLWPKFCLFWVTCELALAQEVNFNQSRMLTPNLDPKIRNVAKKIEKAVYDSLG